MAAMIAQMNAKFGPGKSAKNDANAKPVETAHTVAPLSKLQINLLKNLNFIIYLIFRKRKSLKIESRSGNEFQKTRRWWKRRWKFLRFFSSFDSFNSQYPRSSWCGRRYLILLIFNLFYQ